MDFKNENRHMVDVLFVITLFFVFALSALTLVILGANVYKSTVNHMDSSFNTRTSNAYVLQKLRQNDDVGTISIMSQDGVEYIVMTKEVNDTLYNTYLYEYDGHLYELLERADMELDPSYGTLITDVDSFGVNQVNDSLYSFTIKPAGSPETTLFISTHTQPGGKDHE